MPDVFLRVQLRAFWRQRHERDIRRDDEPARQMPASLIEQQDGVPARRDLRRNFGEVQVHRLGVACRQDERGARAVLRANRAEDVGRGGALVMRRRWACSATRPTPGDLVFLADARLIGEPDFYIGRIDAFVLGDLRHTRRETFLKSSIAPSACA